MVIVYKVASIILIKMITIIIYVHAKLIKNVKNAQRNQLNVNLVMKDFIVNMEKFHHLTAMIN